MMRWPRRIGDQPPTALAGGWLLLTALLSLALFYGSGGLEPQLEPDSDAYLNFDWRSALSSLRTPGYPLFLRVITTFGGLAAIPAAHWAAMVMAAGVFLWGLRQAGYRPATAVACASALMLSRGVLELGHFVMPDSLAISMAVASAGCFFALLRPRPRWGVWCGLAASTFAAYQLRPAYLFLIPLWPLLLLLLDALIVHRAAPWRERWRRLCIITALTVLPLVAYCSARWAIVGHWGLVSFGGYNVIGVAGQWLDADLATQLPQDVQPLAAEMLQRRRQWGRVDPPESFTAMESMYNPTVWQMAVPAARSLSGGDEVAANDALTRLARQILLRRPWHYARWLAWNARHALAQILTLTVTDLAVVLTGLLLIVAHGGALIGGVFSRRGAVAQPGDASQHHRETHLLFWTAAGFAAAKALLVILVEPANGRYMSGAMVLMPAVVAVWAIHYLQDLTAAARQRH